MIKKYLLFILFLLIMQNAYSQYEDYDTEKTKFFEISLRYIWPELRNPQGLVQVNFGAGMHFPVIPHFLNPGVYLEFGFSPDWVDLFSDDTSSNRDSEYWLSLNLGARIYNLINLGMFSIITFAGYNFILSQKDERSSIFIHNPILGFSLAILGIGLEYAYYIPTKFSDNVRFHHISILYRTTF